MCGIAALIDTVTNSPIPPSLLKTVNNLAMHRGPDDEGYSFWKNVGLAHRRLSIIDVSADGHQPMVRGELEITYNGEVYNYIELRNELQELGATFETRCDTEVVLAAYEYWGERCVERFNGMWAFVILDKKHNRLFCSRDRFGKKPLHFARVGNLFAIASEIKQFTALPYFTAKLNEPVAAAFLLCSDLNHGSETFFESVSLLSPGHNLKLDLATGHFVIEEWYRFPSWQDGNEYAIGDEEAIEHFRELLQSSIRLRLRSDVPVGCFLSGGLDSSSITCSLPLVSSDTSQLATISACWDDPQIDEQQYIDAVSSFTNIRAIKYFPNLDELSSIGLLDQVVYHQEQPIATASHLVEYVNFRTAREHGFTVMFTGQGSDEVFCGYPAFQFALLNGLIRARKWKEFLHEWQSQRMQRNWGHFQLLKAYCLPKHRVWLARNCPALDTNWLLTNSQLWRTQDSYRASSSLRHMSWFQIRRASLPYQLYSEDKSSMAASVESRLPFVDYRLVEFGFSLPDQLKLSRGCSKRILRRALEGLAPTSVCERKSKLGLPAPHVELLRRNESAVLSELNSLADSSPRMFSRKFANSLAGNFMNADFDHALVFRLLSFSRWTKLFSVSC
jgi:asparagine synthase (glutamine-hydrolysing)